MTRQQRASRLRAQLTSFLGFRIVSGLMSFVLFALLARWFDVAQTKSLYYLLFLFGFYTSALRMLATLGAGIQGHETRTARLRKACAAYGCVLPVAVAMAPLAFWMLGGLGLPVWAWLGLLAVLLAWGVDLDLTRAVVGRASVLAPAAASGGVLALMALGASRSYAGAVAAILLQWLPLCALNLYLFWRLRARIFAGVRAMLAGEDRRIWGTLGVVLFDGLIINTPFFLGAMTPPELGLSVGVATRLFVSSLILMPLITHWSNGTVLGTLASRAGLPVPWMHAGLTAASGALAAGAFALAFTWIAGTRPTAVEIAAAITLLLAYSAFAAAGRYRSGAMPAMTAWLVLLVAANAGVVVLLVRVDANALALAVSQAIALLTAAALMSSRPRR